MERRAWLKNMAFLAAATTLPVFAGNTDKKSLPLHFVGLGGGGCNILETAHRIHAASFYTGISTPPHQRNWTFGRYITIDVPVKEIFYNHGVEIHRIHDSEIELTEEIKSLFDSAHHYVLFAGLGGYAGTKLMGLMFEFLKKEGKSFQSIAATPFRFEGKNRKSVSQNMVSRLNQYSEFTTFNLETIHNQFGNIPLSQAFERANELTIDQVSIPFCG